MHKEAFVMDICLSISKNKERVLEREREREREREPLGEMGRPPRSDRIGVRKGPWTLEEDIILLSYIQEHGPGNWRELPNNTGLQRCSKSCRLRWTNYLRPDIRRGNFTDQEEKMIIHLQALLGNRWAAIASYFPQRTDCDIKNHWNTRLKKKLKRLQMGLDGHNQDDGSTSKGLWERRLQMDVHTAKQALCEVLSLHKPSYLAESNPSSEYSLSTRPTQSSTYASSAENIAQWLEGWMRNSPKSAQTGLEITENLFNPQVTMGSSSNVGALGATTPYAFGSLCENVRLTTKNGNRETEIPLTLQEKY